MVERLLMSYYVIDSLTDEQLILAYETCDNKICEFLKNIGLSKRSNNDSVKRIKKRLLERGFKFKFRKRAVSDTVIKNKKIKKQQHTAAKIIYGDYKTRARTKSIPFNLNIDDFCDIVIKNCVYCGSEPKERKRDRYTIYINGVDRVNSDIGYTKDNCAPCCTVCNQMKLNYNLDDFKLHIKKLYDNMKLGDN